MGDTSNISQPVIFPPKGYAIKGNGEAFLPKLCTGIGNFSFLIYNAPGRADIGPQMTLQYSAVNQNGAFVLAWVLRILRIFPNTTISHRKYSDEEWFSSNAAHRASIWRGNSFKIVIKGQLGTDRDAECENSSFTLKLGLTE